MHDRNLISKRASDDLNFIFKSLNSSRFTYNQGFSEKINKDLEEVIVTDILAEKLENQPKTQAVISLLNQCEPKIKKSLFSKKIKVIIKGAGNSYWLVGGEKSSIPGEIEKEGIRENYPAEYILEYKEVNGNLILVNFEDDNGQYLGESRTWPGRPELMKKYKENPNVIE